MPLVAVRCQHQVFRAGSPAKLRQRGQLMPSQALASSSTATCSLAWVHPMHLPEVRRRIQLVANRCELHCSNSPRTV